MRINHRIMKSGVSAYKYTDKYVYSGDFRQLAIIDTCHLYLTVLSLESYPSTCLGQESAVTLPGFVALWKVS